MAGVTTMDEMLWPLMEVGSVVLDRCAVCGRMQPLNQHHIVFRSQGNLFRDGRKVEKPTVTLCGDGNNLYGLDANGNRVTWCHGKAHHRMLYFRNEGGALEYLELAEPTKYQDALEMDGWTPVEPYPLYASIGRLRAQGMGAHEAIREMGIDEFG